MENVLEVTNLLKVYGDFCAVDKISFNVPRGKVIGFLGPNGAGKTTTIHMLLGIALSNGGEIKYFGKDFFKFKSACLQRINFASAFNTLQGRISVYENLLVFSKLYAVRDPKKKISELVKYFEIEELLNQRFWDLSAGQKTRVNIIKSLINDPELILMDEPTASLDPDIADKTLSLIENLRKSKKLSILYTSHNMNEITRICDEVIFIDHGKIVAQDTPLGLTKRLSKSTLRLTFEDKKNAMEKFLKVEDQRYTKINKNTVAIKLNEKDIPKVIFGISQAGVWITDIEVEKPTLEDVFLQIARGKKYVH